MKINMYEYLSVAVIEQSRRETNDPHHLLGQRFISLCESLTIK